VGRGSSRPPMTADFVEEQRSPPTLLLPRPERAVAGRGRRRSRIARGGSRARQPLARCAVAAARADCCPLGQAVRPAFGAGSVERAGGEHEAGRCPRFGPAAGVKRRSVQAVSGRCLDPGLGFPTVGDDPCHDRLEVGPCGHDRGALDDGASRGMGSGQSSDQGPNRVVVHVCHRSPFQACGPSPRRGAPPEPSCARLACASEHLTAGALGAEVQGARRAELRARPRARAGASRCAGAALGNR
jgi:hypothetical protein